MWVPNNMGIKSNKFNYTFFSSNFSSYFKMIPNLFTIKEYSYIRGWKILSCQTKTIKFFCTDINMEPMVLLGVSNRVIQG